MIPLPTAADDHQRVNAETLQTAGAARMILQKELNGASLAKEIIDLIEEEKESIFPFANQVPLLSTEENAVY